MEDVRWVVQVVQHRHEVLCIVPVHLYQRHSIVDDIGFRVGIGDHVGEGL